MKTEPTIIARLSTGFAAALLAACGGHGPVLNGQDGPGEQVISTEIPDAVPRAEPRSRYGNPEQYEVFGRRYVTLKTASGFTERGIASWYGTKFHGQRTSSGEPYDMYAMTAAHKTLPLPTYVQVTNLENGRSAIVKVNDRGPFHDNRIIDLSYAAANKLGIAQKGTGLVEIRAIDPGRSMEVRNDVPLPDHKPEVFIQLGAFSSQDNARALKAHLDGLELGEVSIDDAQVDGAQLYRVRIGPLGGVEDADRTAGQLSELGLDSFNVVID